jgi:hypothetical protein
MTSPIEWITAIAAIIGASGGGVALAGAARARWNLRAEILRNSQDRHENELHRLRHAHLYRWWHDMPDGPGRIRAMHWFGEYTGASDPYHGGLGGGPLTPGLHAGDADGAYRDYVSLLDAIYHPGRPGPEPRPIAPPPDETPAIAEPGTSPGS